MVAIAAFVIGVLIAVQGVAGLASPEAFVAFVRAFQVPPVIYFAAIARVVIGVILVLAARPSRAPRLLRGFGILVVLGGLLTPFVGARFASVVLGWWSDGGPTVVRAWAGASLLIGTFIVYAVGFRKKHAA